MTDEEDIGVVERNDRLRIGSECLAREAIARSRDDASTPLLVDFLAAHPHVMLDLVAIDADGDIVAEGYDAGIQSGEVIDRDMIAVPVTGGIRMTVVGSLAYFTRHGKPRHPRDLVEHACLNWHPARVRGARARDRVRGSGARGDRARGARPGAPRALRAVSGLRPALPAAAARRR